jgi:hypothetical protein
MLPFGRPNKLYTVFCKVPTLTIPNNLGVTHSFKIKVTAEGGSTLTTDKIEMQVKCNPVPATANYTTFFPFEAIATIDSTKGIIKYPFIVTAGTDSCAPESVVIQSKSANMIDAVFAEPTAA